MIDLRLTLCSVCNNSYRWTLFTTNWFVFERMTATSKVLLFASSQVYAEALFQGIQFYSGKISSFCKLLLLQDANNSKKSSRISRCNDIYSKDWRIDTSRYSIFIASVEPFIHASIEMKTREFFVLSFFFLERVFRRGINVLSAKLNRTGIEDSG